MSEPNESIHNSSEENQKNGWKFKQEKKKLTPQEEKWKKIAFLIFGIFLFLFIGQILFMPFGLILMIGWVY